jgi:hypothetical protein
LDLSTRIMIFRQQEGLSAGYKKRELQVETIAEVAPLLKRYLTGRSLEISCEESATQDLFICTHGSHDKCCARYGYPFYRKAKAIAADLGLDQVRVWQVSHIGGHRFAPTLVSFPDGRYYGALDEASLTAILTRTGNNICLNTIYRGWGILPKQVQVLERELALQHGWGWFGYRVSYKIINVDTEMQSMQVELYCEKLGFRSLTYIANIIEDTSKTQMLIGSCNSDQLSKFVKFKIEDLQCMSQAPDWGSAAKLAIAPSYSKHL